MLNEAAGAAGHFWKAGGVVIVGGFWKAGEGVGTQAIVACAPYV